MTAPHEHESAGRVAWKIDDLAVQLGVGRTWLYGAIAKGPPEGPRVIRLGRSVRVLDEDLREWLGEKREAGALASTGLETGGQGRHDRPYPLQQKRQAESAS